MKILTSSIICLMSILNPLSGYQEIQIRNSADLDRVWEAYFADSNPSHIRQILEFIGQDETVMFFSYEYINRHFIATMLSNLQERKVAPQLEDLNRLFLQMEQENPGFNDRLNLVTSAMWFLDTQVNNNPNVKKDFNSVLKENPHLDYAKKIKRMLGK